MVRRNVFRYQTTWVKKKTMVWVDKKKKIKSVFHRFSQVSKKRTISQEIYNPGKTAGEIDQWV